MGDQYITAKIANIEQRFVRINVRHIVSFERAQDTKDTIEVLLVGGWEYHIKGDVTVLESALVNCGSTVFNMEALADDHF